MSFETSYELPDSQYGDVVMLQEYKEQYSIVAARKGQDGKVWMEWVYPQRDKKPIEKTVPMKVGLGGHAQAIECLEYLLKELKGGGDEPPF
jgi:hypothetical protein